MAAAGDERTYHVQMGPLHIVLHKLLQEQGCHDGSPGPANSIGAELDLKIQLGEAR